MDFDSLQFDDPFGLNKPIEKTYPPTNTSYSPPEVKAEEPVYKEEKNTYVP